MGELPHSWFFLYIFNYETMHTCTRTSFCVIDWSKSTLTPVRKRTHTWILNTRLCPKKLG